jgi:hypothetical protein
MPPSNLYRQASWPKKPPRPRPRRFRPQRALPVQTSLLLAVTVYLLLAMYVAHVRTLVVSWGVWTPLDSVGGEIGSRGAPPRISAPTGR